MNPLRIAASALLCTLALVSQQAAAVEYQLPAANSRLIGENQEYVVPADNRPLEQIASDFQLGLTNIMEANPGVDPYLPKAGSTSLSKMRGSIERVVCRPSLRLSPRCLSHLRYTASKVFSSASRTAVRFCLR